MQSPREILEEMDGNKHGLVTLREVIGAAGKVHRHRAKVVDGLVRDGLAIWVNSSRTIAQITRAGRHSLQD